MDNWFLTHNGNLENPEHFRKMDSDLIRLNEQRLVYQFPLLEKLPIDVPGIFVIQGAHQTGKTTLLKLWIEKLLMQGVPPNTIAFFPGELIAKHHGLFQSLKKQLSSMPTDRLRYLIIDDASSIKDFEKVIQTLKSHELLDSVLLILSGVDVAVTGITLQNIYHLYSLSFRETVLLKRGDTEPTLHALYEEFDEYLLHGGNLKAINEVFVNKQVSDKTLIAYSDWICKETERRGKQERFLREIIKATFKHYNNQITWNALAPELSIDHPKTIGDYFAWLEALDILFVQYALLEKELTAAPKKARKIMFTDPFYFHAMNAWINPIKNIFDHQMKNTLENVELNSNLVKSSVITHFRRFFSTYYIKSEGEVDLAYIKAERFWPIEITWTSQLRAKDLKQILKYPNGRILTKTDRSGIIEHIQTEPLPIALWQLEDSNL